jgi:hypothetical protein
LLKYIPGGAKAIGGRTAKRRERHASEGGLQPASISEPKKISGSQLTEAALSFSVGFWVWLSHYFP